MNTITDFLNHGILPMIGRAELAASITAFWQATSGSDGLRAFLLTGEAGAGKSRLMEQTLEQINASGGLAVHLKLYPEVTSSMAPLLLQGLWDTAAARPLLKMDPEESLTGAITALRRLAHLRPTTLVIEDIHLLTSETLKDFSALVAALSDELLCVLCAARPLDLPARGILEPYLIGEREIGGLGLAETGQLWQALFGEPPDPESLGVLNQCTHGNPLALRSALRGAIKAGAIQQSLARPDIWRVSVDLASFARTLERAVSVLSSGMAANLSDQEREASAQLSCLGEVFSREAAACLLPDSDEKIRSLKFKGILSENVTSIRPLAGMRASQSGPLAFTHSLVHDQFLKQAVIDPGRLLDVIASDVPLYSVLPYQFLPYHVGGLQTEARVVSAAADNIFRVAIRLDHTSDWPLALNIWRAAEALAEQASAGFGDEFLLEMRIKTLAAWLQLSAKRIMGQPVFHDRAQQLVDMTGGETPAHLAEYRLIGFVNMPEYRFYELYPQVQSLVGSFPGLRFSRPYIQFMAGMAKSAAFREDGRMSGIAEQELLQITGSRECDEATRRYALVGIGAGLLPYYTSAAEYQKRVELDAQLLELHSDEEITLYVIMRTMMLGTSCRVDELISWMDRWSPKLKELGLSAWYYIANSNLIFARVMRGDELESVLQQMREFLAEIDNRTLFEIVRWQLAHYVVIGMILRNEIPAALRTAEEFEFLASVEKSGAYIVLALHDEDPEPRLRTLSESGLISEENKECLQIVLRDSPGQIQKALAIASEACRTEVFWWGNILDLFIVAELTACATALGDGGSGEVLAEDLHFGLISALEFLSVCGLNTVMSAILNKFSGYLSSDEIGSWTDRIARIGSDRQAGTSSASPDESGGLMLLKMFGNTSVILPDGTEKPIRGGRLRQTIGLMVANELLDQPVGYHEFCRVSAGGEDHPERARKTMNGAVLRLREAISQDAIITETAKSPRINLAAVRVDLLEATGLLSEVRRSMRTKTLLRAVPLLNQALQLIGGEVAFASLYDEVFETLREDFENGLRAAVIPVAGGLLREGDYGQTETILRDALRSMPGDPDLEDMLRQALNEQGKRAQALRVEADA